MPPEVEKNISTFYADTMRFFDRLEDRVRHRLSLHPLIYALVAGVGIVMFWRGAWQMIDGIPLLHFPFLSFAVSLIILLLTGTFVSFFIGDQILISGLRQEKRVAEKTEKEVEQEETELSKILERLHFIEHDILDIKDMVQQKSTQRRTTKKPTHSEPETSIS